MERTQNKRFTSVGTQHCTIYPPYTLNVKASFFL
jgi:hypothetical protein